MGLRAHYPMRLPVFHSLKLQIVLIALAAAVLAAVGSALTTQQALVHEHDRDEIRQQRVESEHVARLIDSKLQTVLEALKATAMAIEPMDFADQAAMLRTMSSLPALGALLNPISVFGPDANVIARTDGTREIASPQHESVIQAVREAYRAGQASFSHPAIGTRSQRPRVVVVVPIFSHGRIKGALAAGLDLQSHSLFTSNWKAAGKGVEDLVIDAEGTILAHSDPSRILTKIDAQPRTHQLLERLKRDPTSAPAVAALDETTLVSAARIGQANWTYVRLVPRAVVEAPFLHAAALATRTAIVAGSVSALLAGLLALWLVRPIASLTQRVRQLQDEGADSASTDTGWPARGGEVGELSQAFQQLLQRQRRDADELRRLLAQTEAVLANAETGIALVCDARVEMISDRLRPLLGWNAATEAAGRNFSEVFATPQAWQAIERQVRGALAENRALDTETQMRRADGTLFWAHVRVRALPSIDGADRSRRSIWVIEDITDRRDEHQALNWAATHDALTGLTNRAAFEAMLEKASTSASDSGAPFCALFIDLDRFKQVNDISGHAAGDQMLKDVARLLSTAVRQTDVAARMGGDEFAVLLPNCSRQRAMDIAEGLRASIERHRLEWNGHTHSIGASIGLYEASRLRSVNAAQVMQAADQACYDAKRAGRNRVSSFLPLDS